LKIVEARYLTHSLAGLAENYLSTISRVLVGETKLYANATSATPPRLLIGLVWLINKLDSVLFKQSKTSVGLMVVGVKCKKWKR